MAQTWEKWMSKQIGVGVISLGWMGRLHARSYRALAERYQGLEADVQLVAACDPVEAARDEAVAALGFERAYADYRELLADPDVDVVSICSPNFLHHEIALAAIAAGKPFWIEKPMGVSAAQSREIAEAAEAAGLITPSASTTGTPPPSSAPGSSSATAGSGASPTCGAG